MNMPEGHQYLKLNQRISWQQVEVNKSCPRALKVQMECKRMPSWPLQLLLKVVGPIVSLAININEYQYMLITLFGNIRFTNPNASSASLAILSNTGRISSRFVNGVLNGIDTVPSVPSVVMYSTVNWVELILLKVALVA